MPDYVPPLRDIDTVMNAMLGAGDLARLAGCGDYDWDTMRATLDTAARFAVDVALPLNAIGDKGCVYDITAKSVKTPEGFREAFRRFADDGFIGLAGNPLYGGGGAPHLLDTAVTELFTASNFSFSTYPGLSGGHARAVNRYATERHRALVLPRLYAGLDTGTMCLTEGDAGSDLARIRAMATPVGNGLYAIDALKIFISCGEHDLTEQKWHLILARMPDAPPGIKGISLFSVPKFMPGDSGEPDPQAFNHVTCEHLWHKLGINGSATTTLAFNNAAGWLVGEPHKGMAAMFEMMNDARIKVALQGLGLAERAYQAALLYASQRIQGARISEARDPKAARVAIIEHANKRGDLMDMACQIQGARAMIYHTALHQDLAEHGPKAFRNSANEYVALMTSVLKSLTTDLSVEIALKAMEMHGGAGYITETGVEQFLRDAEIGKTYEGSNDIQAMSFVLRQVLDPKDFLYRIGIELRGFRREIINARLQGRHPDEVSKLERARAAVGALAGGDLIGKGLSQQHDELLADSKPFLDMFGAMTMGRMWLKMMNAAQDRLEADPDMDGPTQRYLQGQLTLGRHYIHRIMAPKCGLGTLVGAPSRSILDMRSADMVAALQEHMLGDQRPDRVMPRGFEGKRFILEGLKR